MLAGSRRIIWPIVVVVTLAASFIIGRQVASAAVSYYGTTYYLHNSGSTNYAWTGHNFFAGDWTCGLGSCQLPVTSNQQYVNITSTSYSLGCYYSEVYDGQYGLTYRRNNQSMTYYNTPQTISETSWGYRGYSDGLYTGVAVGNGYYTECDPYGYAQGLYYRGRLGYNSNYFYILYYGN